MSNDWMDDLIRKQQRAAVFNGWSSEVKVEQLQKLDVLAPQFWEKFQEDLFITVRRYGKRTGVVLGYHAAGDEIILQQDGQAPSLAITATAKRYVACSIRQFRTVRSGISRGIKFIERFSPFSPLDSRFQFSDEPIQMILQPWLETLGRR